MDAGSGRARTEIVQRVEDDVERLEPRDVELGLLDVPMYRRYVDIWIERRCRLGCNLYDAYVWRRQGQK